MKLFVNVFLLMVFAIVATSAEPGGFGLETLFNLFSSFLGSKGGSGCACSGSGGNLFKYFNSIRLNQFLANQDSNTLTTFNFQSIKFIFSIWFLFSLCYILGDGSSGPGSNPGGPIVTTGPSAPETTTTCPAKEAKP